METRVRKERGGARSLRLAPGAGAQHTHHAASQQQRRGDALESHHARKGCRRQHALAAERGDANAERDDQDEEGHWHVPLVRAAAAGHEIQHKRAPADNGELREVRVAPHARAGLLVPGHQAFAPRLHEARRLSGAWLPATGRARGAASRSGMRAGSVRAAVGARGVVGAGGTGCARRPGRARSTRGDRHHAGRAAARVHKRSRRTRDARSLSHARLKVSGFARHARRPGGRGAHGAGGAGRAQRRGMARSLSFLVLPLRRRARLARGVRVRVRVHEPTRRARHARARFSTSAPAPAKTHVCAVQVLAGGARVGIRASGVTHRDQRDCEYQRNTVLHYDATGCACLVIGVNYDSAPAVYPSSR